MALFDWGVVILMLLTGVENPKSVKTDRRHVILLSFGVFGCAVAFTIMLGSSALGVFVTPSLVQDTDQFDFGTLNFKDNLDLSHTFRVENRSRNPVRITGFKSSCSCTVASIPSEAVPPGGVTFIQVRANWRGRIGPQHERVTLNTDSILQPAVTLSVSGRIVAAVVYWPRHVDFGDVCEGHTYSRAITIAPGADGHDFGVESIATSDSAIKLVRGAVTQSHEHNWSVQVLGTSPVGKQRRFSNAPNHRNTSYIPCCSFR
jgi:hypothetical protein